MKFSDRLKKVNEGFNVYMYDNGYMVELSGKDKKDNYSTVKIICSTSDELIALIKEITSMERDI